MLNKSYGFYIEYEKQPIDTIELYNQFMEDIEKNPNLTEYLKLRAKIAKCTTVEGILIAPNRLIHGMHGTSAIVAGGGEDASFKRYEFDENGLFKEIGAVKSLFNNRFPLIRDEALLIPGTDLALIRAYYNDGSYKLKPLKPITKFPIIQRATIDDIKNHENRFYALSATFHFQGMFTDIGHKYFHIAACKPTPDDPEVKRVLNFRIDDKFNKPLHFRTAHGDSIQPFVLITPDQEIKLVGTHNPAGNSFLVENVAHPEIAVFIDNVVAEDEADAVPEPFSISTAAIGLITYLKTRKIKRCLRLE